MTKFIDAIYQKVFATYSFPLTTVNDRKSQMTSTLWKQLCKKYGISIKFFSAHHLKTDGQTESANKMMKKYLYAYINHTQDDWVNNLPIAEFAVSKHINMSMAIMPFFVDYGFHPQTSIKPPSMYKSKLKAGFLATDKIVKRQTKMITFLQYQLVLAQNKQAQFAN